VLLKNEGRDVMLTDIGLPTLMNDLKTRTRRVPGMYDTLHFIHYWLQLSNSNKKDVYSQGLYIHLAFESTVEVKLEMGW